MLTACYTGDSVRQVGGKYLLEAVYSGGSVRQVGGKYFFVFF